MGIKKTLSTENEIVHASIQGSMFFYAVSFFKNRNIIHSTSSFYLQKIKFCLFLSFIFGSIPVLKCQTFSNINVGNPTISFPKKTVIPHKEIAIGKINWVKKTISNDVPLLKTNVSVTEKTFQIPTAIKLNYKTTKTVLKNPKVLKRLDFKIPENASVNVKYLNVLAGLPSNSVKSITVDDENSVWGIYTDGIFKLSGGSVYKYAIGENFPNINSTKIKFFKGAIYITTFGDGFFKLENNILTNYKRAEQDGSDHLMDLEFIDNKIYIATYDKSVIYFENNNFYSLNSGEMKFNTVIADLTVFDGVLFGVGTKNVCFSLEKNKCITYQFGSSTANEFELIAGNRDGFYVSSVNAGIFYYSQAEKLIFTSKNCLNVSAMVFSKNKNLWLSSKDGYLSLIRGSKLIKTFTDIDIITKGDVNDFCQDNQSNVWFSSYLKGIGLIMPSNFIISTFDDLVNPKSSFCLQSNDGNTYVERKDGGLIKTNELGEVFEAAIPKLIGISTMKKIGNDYFITAQSGFFKLSKDVLVKYELGDNQGYNTQIHLFEKDGICYISNYNYGIIQYKNNIFQKFDGTSTFVYSTFVDSKNRIWVANSDTGLGCFEGDKYLNYSIKEGFVSNTVFAITESENGTIYFATANGLIQLQNNTFSEIIVSSTTSKRFVNVIFEPIKKMIWFSNSNELFSFQLNAVKAPISVYQQNDFIVSGVFKSGGLASNLGKVYAVLEGKTVNYFPFQFPFQFKTFNLSIYQITVEDGKNKNWEERKKDATVSFSSINQEIPIKLNFSPGVYSVRIKFGSNFWGGNSGVRYYYRLNGLDEKWTGPISDNEILFHNLAHGEYDFEVKAENDRGIKFQPVHYKFSIEPHFYQRVWVITLFAIFLALLLWTIFKNYTSFDFKNIESYTSINSEITKIRLVALIGFISFPIFSILYSSQGLTVVNWSVIIIIMAICLLAFLYTFTKKVTEIKLRYTGYIVFAIIATIFIFDAIMLGIKLVSSIELATMLFFAGIIYNTFRTLILFLSFVVVYSAILFNIYIPDEQNLETYISILGQVMFALIAKYFIDLSAINKFSFSSKIIERADFIVIVTERNGKVVYINDYALKFLGKTERDLLGDGWWEYRGIRGEQKEKFMVHLKDLIDNNKTEKVERSMNVGDEIRMMEWKNYVLDGKFLIGVASDVTETSILRQENIKLSSIATNVSNGIVVTDADGKITWCNNSYSLICGYPKEELYQNKPSKFFKVPDFFKEELAKLTEGRAFMKEPTKIPYYKKNGDIFWLLITSTPIYNAENDLMEIIEVCSDVTEQKAIEDKYEYIINNAQDIIYTLNVSGEFTFVNNSVIAILGMLPESFIGKQYTELIIEEDIPMVSAFYFRQMMKQIVDSYLEFRVRHADGSIRWVAQTVKLNVNGAEVGPNSTIQAIVRDITDLKQKETALQESESNFRLINETIQDVFWLRDTLANKIIYISPSCENLLGITVEEFQTKNNPWENHLLEEDIPILLAARDAMIRDGYYEIEYRIIKKGQIRWVFEKSFGVRNEEGIVIKNAGICIDITEEKASKIVMKRLQLVAEKTTTSITITDPTGKIEWVNDGFAKLTGYSLNEVLGKKPGDFLQGPKTDAKVIANIRRGIKKKCSIREEIINYTKEGREYWIELIIDPIFSDGGEVISYIAVNQDISERKAREKLIENQTQDIVDSINYASRIQTSLLPQPDFIASIIRDFAVINEPKDVIGGDFYFVDFIDDKVIIAVADCTGHGVPGTMMTILGIKGISGIVNDQRIFSPAEILKKLDEYIYFTLNPYGREETLNDGMDIAIVTIDLKTCELTYSGANRPLFYSENEKILKVDATKKAIGEISPIADRIYENTVIKIGDYTQFYMFSDGIQDQFGGEKEKKLGQKNLIALLEWNLKKEMIEQKNDLKTYISNWKANFDQTDDMIWVGFGISANLIAETRKNLGF